jgi:ubiquitin-protein ligase
MSSNSGQGQKRLQKELIKLQKSPEPDITANIVDENIFQWEVVILGPKVRLLKFNSRKHHTKVDTLDLVSFSQKNIQ